MAKLGRKIGVLTVASMGALAFLRSQLRRKRWFNFYRKTVLITGGSRGLGLELARQLVQMGAQVAICARTKADLDRARTELGELSNDVLSFECDVRLKGSVDEVVRGILAAWGKLDVVFNVAGIIEVGPLDAMTDEDFADALATHFWGPLHTTFAVLPEMRRQGWGRILNVASMGGKRAVPHMVPYDASKFALVGLSQGMRAELMKENIYITTACPSLMRTGSPRNAIFKGQHRKEYAWFSIADSLPLLTTDVQKAAKKMIEACQYGDAEVIFPSITRLTLAISDLMPNLTSDILYLLDKAMPKMGGIGTLPARGYESESRLSESMLTSLSRKAAVRNNEMNASPAKD